MLISYAMVGIAIAANIVAVYFMKLCGGMTQPWPTLGMILANMLTLWFLGRAMTAGAPVSAAVTALTVGVMIGSFFIGLSFGERVSLIQAVGGAIAVAGVVIGNMSAASAS
ncbi:small multidrug resistance pump [Paraburkholderia sp. GAS448]|uniref:SMR family transporter n=1 Tax=Paraburkholderia sp. GAS448 TaxID=3035136 RepID=UPI003D259C73